MQCFLCQAYSLSAEANLYCLLAPLIVTHKVSGSLPTCSLVAPVVSEMGPGTVTGIVVPQLLPPAVYTLTDVMLAPSAELVHVMLGRHRSRV